jgi:predicted RNase H-like HicB family nuclease
MRLVVLHPDLEDGGWVAEVPSLPGCVSQGETKEETLAHIREAISTWLEAAQEAGIPTPKETFDVQVCLV